jgi:uncharacterized protein (UPF0333 family)
VFPKNSNPQKFESRNKGYNKIKKKAYFRKQNIMNKNLLIIGGVLVVAVGVAYWYMKSTEKDTEPLTQEDKETLKKIEVV